MKLSEKIATIQKEIGSFQRETEAFKYKYVTLDQIQEKLNPLLEKYKLLLTQPLACFIEQGGINTIATVVQDLESEEQIESNIALPSNVKPQDMGSAITYYRRYSITSLFNLVTVGEDDDGASASKTGGKITNDDFNI